MNRHQTALEILASGTVIPATPLALDACYQFDQQRQRTLLRYYLAAGAGGVAVAVHTTQFEIRDPAVNLLEQVLSVSAQEFDRFEAEQGRVIVRICGVCGDTPQAVAEATLARELGFDAVLLSPGGLHHLSEEALLARTRAVAEIMPVIGFYLQTSVGGRRLSYEYWAALCEIQNVVAIKSAPFDRYQTLDLVRAAALSSRGKEIALYTGNDDNIVVDLLTRFSFEKDGKTFQKRFEGGLLGHWAIWTHQVVQMFEQIRRVREQESIPAELLTLAAQITDANGAVFDVANGFAGCIPGVHEILRQQGLMEGIWCLNRDEILSKGQLEELMRVTAMYPHLNDNDFVKPRLSSWLAS